MPKYNYPKVVVTGFGAVTPIGNTVPEYWQAILDGKSGGAMITRFDTEKFDTKFACEVKNYDPLLHINRKEVQRMDMFTQFGISAASEAVAHSGLNLETINKERAGVIFGSGIGGMWTYHHQQQALLERDGNPDRISPFFVPMLISDIAAGHIAIRFGFKGANYATVSACATSSHAIATAVMHIQRGDADIMLAGGSEAVVCPMGVGGFNALKALSTRNDEPATASRPFDATRDGFIMGEGGGVLVLETEQHALDRGATIYAELAGIGLTDDAYHITQPAPGGEGVYRAMKLAVEDAGLQPQDIDYVKAHGTSTPFNDKTETAAIKTLFGDHAYKMNVSSIKSMTGHLLGAAGAVEAIGAVLGMYHGIVPPTINYKTPDPELDLNYTPNTPQKREIKALVANTLGFGGHNAALCFKKY